MKHSLPWILAAFALGACSDDTATSGGGGAGAAGPGGAGGEGATAGAGAAGGVGGAVGDYNCDAAAGDPPALALMEVAQLDAPIQAKSPPGLPDLLFIAEKGGRIVILDNGTIRPQPFLDISNLVLDQGEQGLLGFAFHPGYEMNGRFFVHYTDTNNGDNVIVEYARGGDDFTAGADAVTEVLRHYTDQSNHNGGAVEFGPDGYIYISMGDGGTQGDPGCDAMNPDNLLGKIMRLDVDAPPGGDGYPAAPGNPDGAKQYHIGMRNPWRISFDPCVGTLYVGDVGQDAFEEVSVADPGDGALNFGWPVREASTDYGTACPFPMGTLVDPIAAYPHAQGLCDIGGSISGGYVYRGFNVPGLRGWYLYGDYCTGDLYRLKYENGDVTGDPVLLNISLLEVSAFGQDGHGEVYVLELPGRVYRVDAE